MTRGNLSSPALKQLKISCEDQRINILSRTLLTVFYGHLSCISGSTCLACCFIGITLRNMYCAPSLLHSSTAVFNVGHKTCLNIRFLVHPVHVETFQSGPEWWTDGPELASLEQHQ